MYTLEACIGMVSCPACTGKIHVLIGVLMDVPAQMSLIGMLASTGELTTATAGVEAKRLRG